MIESEKTLEKRLGAEAKKIGGWSLKLPAIHVSGIPDRLLLLPGGRVVFVELKTTKEKPRKIQLVIHRKLRKLGFRVEIIDTTAQIIALIEEYEPAKT